MTFDGGNNIDVKGLYPKDAPVATKIFTVAGNNTTDLDMGYSLYLEVDENTFSNYAIQYKLTSENTSNNGTVINSNEELIPIKTGTSSTLLGYGTYESPTEGEKLHTYTLEIYFPNMPFNQNEDKGKTFGMHIKIKDYSLENDRIISSLDIVETYKRMDMYYYYSNMLEKEINEKSDHLSENELAELEDLMNQYEVLYYSLGEDIMIINFLNTTIEREKIESVEFVDSNIVPEGTIGSFDVSEKQNNSVMLWYEEGENPALYKITIGQKNGVKAPIHSDFLFAFLENLNKLSGDLNTNETVTMLGMFSDAGYSATSWSVGDLSNWDTSQVTDMSHMFSGAGYSATSWSIGDLSNWDTSQVKYMSGMFSIAGSNAATFNLELSTWDTSQVTDMSGMFDFAGWHAPTWSVGNLSNWDTSQVTDMSHMFAGAGYTAPTWSVGDLSNWDTSQVTNMSYIFTQAGESAITWSIGDLSTWDTSQVTDMSQMFYRLGWNATTWSIGDLSNWDTSQVTNMIYMFTEAGYSAASWSVGDLSNWDTSRVIDMTSMFRDAGYSATTWSIGDLSNWDTSKATNMYRMFAGAGYNATTWSIGNITNWDTSSYLDSKCHIINGLGSQATISLASTIAAWGCN